MFLALAIPSIAFIISLLGYGFPLYLREIGRLLETFGARLKFIVRDAKYGGIEIENYEAEAVLTLLEELKAFALKRIEAEKEIVKRIPVSPRKSVKRSRRRIRRNDKP